MEGRERWEIIGKHYVSDLTDGNIDAKIKLVIAKDAAQTWSSWKINGKRSPYDSAYLIMELIPTQPVNIPCGRKPEYHAEKLTYDFWESIDWLFSA